MKNLSEYIITVILAVTISSAIYYAVSWGIVEIFGKEMFMIVILGLALFFIIKDVLKKNKKQKNE